MTQVWNRNRTENTIFWNYIIIIIIIVIIEFTGYGGFAVVNTTVVVVEKIFLSYLKYNSILFLFWMYLFFEW